MQKLHRGVKISRLMLHIMIPKIVMDDMEETSMMFGHSVA